jgi:hypothetical protein
MNRNIFTVPVGRYISQMNSDRFRRQLPSYDRLDACHTNRNNHMDSAFAILVFMYSVLMLSAEGIMVARKNGFIDFNINVPYFFS